jgi:uncharacterized protein YbjT (DUF2867 family)
MVAGATGLVGRRCLRLLAGDDAVDEVRALVRRPLPEEFGPRVRECRTDFERLGEHAAWFAVDWVFCALGTTMHQAGSREAFRHVDHDYPLAIAKLALSRGARHFLLVSAKGANARSPFFYYRVKGELEDDVRALGYRSLTIARPSLLLGQRPEVRSGEQLAARLAHWLPQSWRPVDAVQVALALVQSAHQSVPGVRILDNAMLRAVPLPSRSAQAGA